MLLLGTCNPPGEADGYNGLYLTDAELRAAVKEQTLLGVPVKTEHAGAEVGRIVSVFLGPKSELQAVLEVDENSLTGCLAGGFVRDGVAADLSLGYTVDVRHSSGSSRIRHKQTLAGRREARARSFASAQGRTQGLPHPRIRGRRACVCPRQYFRSMVCL